ncbi:MAG: MerR family DNA-binding transcriptional regulator [Coriobacteriia bacterium]|nr:MerR family DNA-binding transcriptional regulator [Coriobacteriia bacterium]
MTQDHLMSIKEFSQFTGISQSALRYYDEIGVFAPNVRKPNGYRYYTPEQITAVNFVQVMSFLKVPLKTIRGLADERGPRQLMTTLLEHSTTLNNELRRISDLYSLMSVYQNLINEGLNVDEDSISVRTIESIPIVLGPPACFERDAEYHEPFLEFYDDANMRRVNLAYPIGGYFASLDVFLKTPGSPQMFFSLDPTGGDEIAAGDYLVGYARGHYGVVSNLPERLVAYADEHGLKLDGPLYKLYILDEVSEPDPDRYLLRVLATLA